MADSEKQTLTKIGKLVERRRELDRQYQEQASLIDKEFESLLAGGVGIGEILKRLEKHFDELWCVRYAPQQTGKYVWNFAQDRSQWKRLLNTLTVEELERRACAYHASSDKFYVQARHSFGIFVRSINQFAGDAGPALGRTTSRLVDAVRDIKANDRPALPMKDDDVAF